MILDAQPEREGILSAKHLAEKFFRSSAEAEAFRKHAGLQLKTERLEDYFLLTLAPIRSTEVENRLNRFIRPVFPQAFIVGEWAAKKMPPSKLSTLPIETSQHRQENKPDKAIPAAGSWGSLVKGLDNEWLALIVLALSGLFLVVRSASQIRKIKRLQRTLEEAQEKNSHYLNSAGRQYE